MIHSCHMTLLSPFLNLMFTLWQPQNLECPSARRMGPKHDNRGQLRLSHASQQCFTLHAWNGICTQGQNQQRKDHSQPNPPPRLFRLFSPSFLFSYRRKILIISFTHFRSLCAVALWEGNKKHLPRSFLVLWGAFTTLTHKKLTTNKAVERKRGSC